MASYVVSDTSLTAVADAIREKTGKSAQITFPTGFVSEIGDISGGGGYDFSGGSFFTLLDQYATERGMTKIELSFASDQTEPLTIQHNLGTVPKEMLLYPKNPVISGSAYQMGWVIEGCWGLDKIGNRTYFFNNSMATSGNPTWFPNRKDLMSFVSNINHTAYNFTQVQPTSTEVTIRCGTASQTKLRSGEYVLGLI